MNTYINDVVRDENGTITAYEYDANLTTPVIGMLHRNNTFVPNIDRVIFNGPVTKVFFKDGSNVLVKCSANDKYSKDAAIAFAVFKRVVGKPDENGNVSGDGFSTYLKKIVDGAFDQEKHQKEAKHKAEMKKNAAKTQVKKNISRKPYSNSTQKRDHNGRFMSK